MGQEYSRMADQSEILLIDFPTLIVNAKNLPVNSAGFCFNACIEKKPCFY